MPFLEAPKSSERADSIDVVRAICALWVLAAHLFSWSAFADPSAATGLAGGLLKLTQAAARLFQPHAETNPAVLIFIVLSGYCIHRNGFRRADADVRTYAIRRAFRILPVYGLAVLAGVVGFVLARSIDARIGTTLSATQAITADGLLLKLTGISAFVPWLHVPSYQGNAPLTTVMVEIWLYVAYALIAARAVAWGSDRWVLPAIGAIWVAGVVVVSLRPDWQGWWHNGSLAGYLAPWWLGAAMVGVDRRKASRLMVVGAALWIMLSVGVFTLEAPAFWVLELRKMAFALVCGAAIARLDQPRWSAWRPLSATGAAGYSIYALHAPVLILCLALGLPWWGCACLAISAGFLSYWLVEKPFMRCGYRFSA